MTNGLMMYKKKLKAKFGCTNIIGDYAGPNVSALHLCVGCGSEFSIRPKALLSYRSSCLCFKCSRAKRESEFDKTLEQEFVEELHSLHPGITCLDFKGKTKKVKLACECGHEWTNASAFTVLKGKYGCTKCAVATVNKGKTLSADTVLERIAHLNVTVVREYSADDKSLTVRCNKCEKVWTPYLNNLVRGPGCGACHVRKAPTAQFEGKRLKTIKIGKRKAVVQGCEAEVIDFLIKKRNVSPNKIKVFADGTVPVIEYAQAGKTRQYWPDIMVGNRLIEAKSEYWLFKFWKTNVLKAKHCLAQGYKHEMVVKTNGKLVVLPQGWHLKEMAWVKWWLLKSSVKCINVLAIDPGVTNAAWAILRVSHSGIFKVVAHGKILNAMTNMNGDIIKDVKKFQSELLEIVDNYNVNALIIERFQSRGLKGTTIELVNLMIGCLMAEMERIKGRHILVSLITPSQWKNEWNRNSNLEAFYKKVNCVVHQVDAIGIGLYGAYTWLGLKPFADIVKREKNLAKQINQTNSGKVIGGRPK
jgi:Holliday junction resolvasome RuvABC endonuclease subunit